jgi:hypothetical protein
MEASLCRVFIYVCITVGDPSIKRERGIPSTGLTLNIVLSVACCIQWVGVSVVDIVVIVDHY